MLAIPEGKRYDRGRRRRRHALGKRALMATGVAASVAATGLAAAPAGATSVKAGTIYACYSDKTNALYHAAGSKCAKGFTSISWNKQGPQGAQGAKGAQGAQGAKGVQGAQGAQGPNGAVAGYEGVKSNIDLPTGTPEVVASFSPALGFYAVNAMAAVLAGSGNGAVKCWDQVSPSFTTASGIGGVPSRYQTIATNGILSGGGGSPIQEYCSQYIGSHGSGYVAHAEITAVRVTSINAEAATRQHRSRASKRHRPGLRLTNKVTPPVRRTSAPTPKNPARPGKTR